MTDANVSRLHPSGSDQEPRHNESGTRAAHIAGVTAAALGLIVLSAGVTYATIVNNWATAVIGTFYGESAHLAAVDEAASNARATGYKDGHSVGYAAGESEGFARGEDAGFESGRSVGMSEAYEQGATDGYDAEYADGGADAWEDGYGTGYTDGCLSLFNGLGTDRVGDWWDYYYSPAYASYFNSSACS